MSKPPTFTPVKSSAISGYHIDPDSGDLTVQWKGGDVWTYGGVSLERRTAFEGAESKGRYLTKQIIPHHAGRKAS